MPRGIGAAVLRIATGAVTIFLLAPILIVILYAFSASNVQSWPIAAISLRWFAVAWQDDEVRAALFLSLLIAAISTLISLLLGVLAALAVQRMPGRLRDSISFLLVLPIALPGILTGMAMNAYFTNWGIGLNTTTIIIGHATFCIVVVYNNVLARLRRLPRSLAEASADLGANAWQTFRRITLPLIASAVGAGGLLAFALSFDEVIVTTFTAGVQTTLPLWVLGAIRLGQRLPEVNVVVFAVIVATIIPVLLAQRLIGNAGRVAR
jgi:putative spermidine/putrescine transport system permease protein